MATKIAHRGPNDEGYFVHKNVGLASRRLSIIDISGGHQPVFNEDGAIVVVYNGEIYNHLQIKRELEAKGHTFKTKCDTEVLVHLYEEYGTDMVDHLNGMFAFALYDRNKDKLLLARDRLGIKPLYYIWNKDWFLFGSEIKSFLGFKEFRPELDREALHHYLTFRFVPSPMTLFKSVKKLSPGCLLEHVPGKREPKQTRYWDLSFDQGDNRFSLDEAAEEVRLMVQDAVQVRLMSEVPLGVMLSGGVDSSIVASCMKRVAGRQVSTFTINYEEEGPHNEGEYAGIAADAFQTDHHNITVRMDQFTDNLKHMVYFMDEPVADPAAIAVYDLCKFSKEHVTVLLSGIGGDELFAGYGVYAEALYRKYLKHIPRVLWDNIVLPLYSAMPRGVLGRNFVRRVREPVENVFLGSSTIYGGFNEKDKAELYTEDFGKRQADFNSHDIMRGTMANHPRESPLHKMIYADTKHWLGDSHLIMMDKMSMASSVEARVPLLDHRLVELAATLPEELKINLWQAKIVFKRAFETEIPTQIINRSKRGFSTPLHIWFDKSGDQLSDLLTRKDALTREYFDSEYIRNLLQRHREKEGDFSASLFTLLVLELWVDEFLR